MAAGICANAMLDRLAATAAFASRAVLAITPWARALVRPQPEILTTLLGTSHIEQIFDGAPVGDDAVANPEPNRKRSLNASLPFLRQSRLIN